MPQTLAQLVRAKYPGAYDDLSDQQLESSVKAKYPGVYDDLPLSSANPEKPKDRASGLATLGDFVIGALKGGGETAINLGQMLHSIPGVSSLVDKLYGQEGLSQASFPEAHKLTQATNTAQRIGKGVEQIGELMVPAAKVGQATRGLSLGARMLAEGAAGAGMNMAQGGSPVAGAVMGAAMPAAGAAFRGARSLLQGAGANPMVREAVEWGVAHGVPVDAATASGAPIVRAIQGAADATPLGGVVAAQARNRADIALRSAGSGLARSIHPKAQTAVSAGEAIQGKLGQLVQSASSQADEAYNALRQIEAKAGAPKKLTTLVSEVSPDIQKIVPSPPGTPFSKLRSEEKAAIRSLQAEISAQPFAAGDVLDTASGEFGGGAGRGWTSSSKTSRSYKAQQGSNLKRMTANADAVGDIGSSRTGAQVDTRLHDYINGGKPSGVTDKALRVAQRMLGMVEDTAAENPLRRGTGAAFSSVAHPITQTAMETGTTDVLKAVEDTLAKHGVRAGNPQFEAITESGDIPELLRIVSGMRESGASVSEVSQAVKNGITTLIDFKPPTMAMVVDLAPARERLAPVYQRMMRSAQISQPMGAEARALQAMDRLMNAEGQHAPLSVVDDALSDLKGVLRSAPDKLGKGAGALKSVVTSLDSQVQAAAKRAGPEAVQALQTGRAATIRKYVAADLAERLGSEPARVTGKVTARADTAVGLLRDLAKTAPDEVPKVGRAVIDDLLETATQEGGFSRGAGLFEKWQGLGDDTKALLFKPETKTDLDKFFLLAKRMGESPNPSMSGTIAMTGGSTALLFTNPTTGVPLVFGAGALSKLLHSPTGAKMVTRLMSTPQTAPQYRTLLQSLTRAVALESSQGMGR